MVSKKINKTNKYVQINIAIAIFLALVIGAIFINNTGMLTGFVVFGNETNQTIIENETITNETEVNFTIPIINETLNITLTNETTNQTIINKTVINEIINQTIEQEVTINETAINETTQKINQTLESNETTNETEEPPPDIFGTAATVTCNSCGDCSDKLNNTANEIVQLSADISADGPCINSTLNNFDNQGFYFQNY